MTASSEPATISESYVALVNALLRYLLCLSPWRAENLYYFSHVAAPLQDRTWNKVISNGHTGWIYSDKEAGTGRYSTSPPADVDPSSIPTIVIPAGARFGLRTMAAKLVEQTGAAGVDAGLENIYGRLVSMGNGNFETAELRRFFDLVSQCTDASSLTTRLADYQSGLLQGACDCRYPGYFVGQMALFLRSIVDVEPIVLSPVIMERTRLPHLVAVLKFSFDSILENDGPDRIERAGMSLLVDGQRHLEQARACTRDEAFYGHLFRSCAFFNGANIAFEYLTAVSQPGSDLQKSYKRRDHESEEYLVYASSSLLNHFDNLHKGWVQYQDHRERVSKLRAERGLAAAEGQVMEYISLAHFYPAYYRDALLNGLPSPPATTGTAGGATLGKLCGVTS